MVKYKARKRILLLLAALLLAALLAAWPVLAASPNAQAVLDQLSLLQNADISPEWLPDIHANQQGVQTLLDLYEACTAAERAEFTARQQGDLRAYFETLYEVQGRPVSEVDALFAAGSGAEPPPDSSLSASSPSESRPSGSSQSSASQSSAPTVPIGDAPQSSAQSSVPTVPIGDAESGGASMPAAGASPNYPRGGGWQGLFGNGALGAVLLLALVALAAILFVRFLLALRRAGHAPPEDLETDARTQELFGEHSSASRVELALGERTRADGTVLPAEEDAPRRLVLGRPAREKPPRPFQGPPPAEIDLGDMDLPDETPVPADGALGEQPKPSRAHSARKRPQPPVIGSNPDAANSITMRSFGGQPRTGQPAKMPFRQGDPDDLDAIDE